MAKNNNLMTIKPTIRGQQTDSTKELSVMPNGADLEKLFNSFTRFIDASDNTVRTYTISLRQWFNYLRKNHIARPTAADVLKYRADAQAQGKKDTTVRNYIMAIKEFYKWLDSQGYYPNITKGIKSGKVDKGFRRDALTTKQAKKVLSVVDQSTIVGKRNYAMLVVMMTMGLRTIEISRANVEDIRNVGDNTVLYVQGKGHKTKNDMVRIPEHADAALNDYLQARKNYKTGEPLFAGTSNRNKNGRMTTRSIRRIGKAILRKAGYNTPRLSCHSLRHTAATLSLENGAKPLEVQRLLRHASLNTTELYIHALNAANDPASQDVDDALFNN